MTEQESDIFFNIINRFVGFYSREASRKTINETEHEYPFVAMDTRQVFAQIGFVKEYLQIPDDTITPTHTFLDVGCGIGNILLVAEQFMFDVYGFEKDTYPYEIASRLIGENKILQEDIWTYPDYDKFDVVYYFRPFSDHEPQKKFERLIEDSMKQGGILIANHKNNDDIAQDSRFEKLHREMPIWQKLKA